MVWFKPFSTHIALFLFFSYFCFVIRVGSFVVLYILGLFGLFLYNPASRLYISYVVSCLIVADVVGPNDNVFMILLCSILVSRRIAYSYAYASCGGLVSAKNYTAILLLFIC